MDERTKLLVCLSASTAANCIPCFEYYFGKAEAAGLKMEEIQEAFDLAGQVKRGAHMALSKSVGTILGRERGYSLPCDRQTGNSCCG
jgi:hypothetical protein